jgi:hypothetical protein
VWVVTAFGFGRCHVPDALLPLLLLSSQAGTADWVDDDSALFDYTTVIAEY